MPQLRIFGKYFNLKPFTMKTISTLFAILVLSLVAFGQVDLNQTLELTNIPTLHHLTINDLIDAQNPSPGPISPSKPSYSRSNSYRLDSIIGFRYDAILNSWLNKSGIQLTYYPSGELKSQIQFSATGRDEFHFNLNGYVTSFESYYYQNTQWLKSGKTEYIYDNSNNLIEIYQYNVTNNQWENYWKQLFTYDNNDNQITYINAFWVNNAWKNDVKAETIFNNGLLDTIFIFKANFQYWEAQSKIGFTYNTQGLETLSEGYSFDGNYWSLNSKTVSSYTPTDKIAEVLSTYLNGNQWINGSKTNYNYNSNDLLVEKIQYQGDSLTWTNFQLQEFTYDNALNQTKSTIKYGSGNNWINGFESRVTYNSNNQREVMSYYKWNDTISNWANYYKLENVFDANGNVVEYTRYDGQNQVWNILMKKEIQFNLNLSINDVGPDNFWEAYPSYFNQPLIEKGYVLDGSNNFVIADSLTYFYSGPITGIIDNQVSEIQIYPTPTSSAITIIGEFSEPTVVHFFDGTGRMVKSLVITGNSTQISLDNLHTGIYYLKFEMDGKYVSKKIIKQ